MVDQDDAADAEKGDGVLDVLPLGGYPDEPVDWAGHVPLRRVAAGRDPDGGAGGSRDDEADGDEPVGRLPSPRRPSGDEPVSPLARIALARARVRLAVALDVVSFTAACPACGGDCEWIQQRQDTKVHSTVNCPCTSR